MVFPLVENCFDDLLYVARVEIVEKADVASHSNQKDQKMKNQTWEKLRLVSR